MAILDDDGNPGNMVTATRDTSHKKRRIHVGIGRMAVARAPDELFIVGLGSCVAVFIWSAALQLGGLAHILLPEGAYRSDHLPCKYADHAVPYLWRALQDAAREAGSVPAPQWQAKLVGAARLFPQLTHPDLVTIGERTAAAVTQWLETFGVPIVATDLGGTEGRTIYINLADGTIRVRTRSHTICL